MLIVIRQIKSKQSELLESDFWKRNIKLINNHLKTVNAISEIICFGLGHLSNINSVYQLAFLLNLRDQFKSKVLVYDPVFYTIEKGILNELNLEVLTDNFKGRYQLLANTLLFAPHCPHLLLENFLWANWNETLLNSVIIANNFHDIVKQFDSCYVKRTISDNILKETALELVSGDYFEPFNDLSVHSFLSAPLSWDRSHEPESADFYSA